MILSRGVLHKNMDNLTLDKFAETLANVQQLATRIDERMLSVITKQNELEIKLDENSAATNQLLQRVAVLEARDNSRLSTDLQKTTEAVHSLDRRLAEVEGDTGRLQTTTKHVMDFSIKLLWVVVAAFVLWKLKLQAPP
jgi:predicted nuclease with TOPRIM domain